MIRLSHTNTKDLIIKAGDCTKYCSVTALSAQNIFLQANANGAVATDRARSGTQSGFQVHKTACFYRQTSLRNKAVLWHIGEEWEKCSTHIAESVLIRWKILHKGGFTLAECLTGIHSGEHFGFLQTRCCGKSFKKTQSMISRLM